MLKLYTWGTQNARKISIMLSECQLAYEIVPVDIENGDQHTEEFVRISPNGKIPVLVDTELTNDSGQPEPIFETGAILMYLAEKTGRFLPAATAEKYCTIKWLVWQTSNLGPVLGNFSHFASALVKDTSLINKYLAQTRANEPNSYAIERFGKEAFRLLGVLNSVLAEQEYIANNKLSIADFACYPWIESAWVGLSLLNPNINDDYRHVSLWMQHLASRSGVRVGMAKLAWGADLSQDNRMSLN